MYKDIIEGRVALARGPADPGPKELFETRYQHRPEFQVENHGDPGMFSSRLRALRKQITDKHERAIVDSNALANDRLLFPEVPDNDAGRGYPKWGGSMAKSLLKADIDAGIHSTMTPAELRDTRPEYKQFPPKVFRNHIYQDLKSRKKHVKKKKAKMAGVEESASSLD